MHLLINASVLLLLSPEAVSSEINTLVRRGQRRGTVSINGADFAVDLHDMVAMPTEQYAVPRRGLGLSGV